MNLKINQRTLIGAFACGVALLATTSQGFAQRQKEDRRRDDSRVKFTRSHEDKRFDNGITLRHSAPVTDRELTRFFPQHQASYNHYAAKRDRVDVVISPFSFHIGILPRYIERRHVEMLRPPSIYIEAPIYTNNHYVVRDYSHDDYYLSRHREESRWRSERGLGRATEDIEDAFRYNDISMLVRHADPETKIAIFSKGDYQYSIQSEEYMNLTRDFMRNAETTFFNIYRVRYRQNGVFNAYAKHSFRDQDGRTQTIYLSIVLERIGDNWVITQIDTAPQKTSG